MRKGLPIGAVSLLLCVSLFFLPKGPRIRLPQIPVDAGKAALGATIPVAVVVANEGDRSLQVSLSSVSCTCMTPAWKERIIKPGGQEALEVSVKVSREAGVKENYLNLRTNDPKHTDVNVPIRIEAVPIARIKEGSFQFDRIDVADLPQSRKIVLTKGDLTNVAPADLLTIESPSQFFAVEVVERNNDEVRLKGTLTQGTALGTYAGFVELKFPLAYSHSLSIPFYAKLAGDFSVSPGSLFFSAYPGGKFSQKCTIKGAGGGALRLSDIKTTGEIADTLTVTSAESSEGVELIVDFAAPITEERKARVVDGDVWLTASSMSTSAPQAALHIPVRAVCSPTRR